jgi:predicted GIY-YIG superfamily endonuclease
MCGAGPFKQSERDYTFLNINHKDGSNYCISCARAIGLDLSEVIDKSEILENEKIEVISFEKAKPPEEAPIPPEETPPDPIEPPDSGEPEEEEYTPPPPVNVEEAVVEPGPFYVYIGQFTDDLFITGVTKDIKKDLERINSGSNPKLKKLPLELVYYHIEDTKEGAIASKEAIMSMSNPQKELLVEKFITEFFEK